MDGGTHSNLNIINISVFILIGLFNIFTEIIKGSPLWHYSITVVPFFIFIILILKSKNLKTNAYLFAVMGILATVLGVEDNATGAIFLIFSFYIFNKPVTNIIIISLTLIAIVCKFMFLEFTISQAVNMILAYVYIFLIYYILIHPKPEKPSLVFCPELDYETIEIIQHLADGKIYKEISPIMEIKETTIRKQVERARVKMEVKSTTELVIKCHKLHYIRYKLDKSLN